MGSTATFTHYSYTFTALPNFNGTPAIQLYNLTNSSDAIDFANVGLSPSGGILFPAPGQAVPMDQADGVAGNGVISPGGVLSFTTGLASVDMMEDTWVATDGRKHHTAAAT